MTVTKQPVCLTIAGLDPSGGAGVIADIKTFAALGCYGAAAIASVTFQNTTGVFGAENMTAESVRRQVEPVFDDYDVAAVKTGMLPTREIIETVAEIIKERQPKYFVVDPVVRSTSGFDLIDDSALEVLCEMLFPLATIVTPNLPEAERITGTKISDAANLEFAAKRIRGIGAENVLIKGGHSLGNRAVDTLFGPTGMQEFVAAFIETTSTHGTGCTLSAAIAANLALGHDLHAAIQAAKDYVTEAIRTAPGIGKGHGPLNHLIGAK
jgi:hydroxymethylpyrimidine/phosphomethylpyrimidine kinase